MATQHSARARDRLLMALLLSALVHVLIIFGPLGPIQLNPERQPIAVTVALQSPASTTAAPILKVITGQNQARRLSAGSVNQRAIDGTTEDTPAARYLREWVAQAERQGNAAYPAWLQQSGLSGQVVMAVTLAANGAVRQVAIIGGTEHAQLREAAHKLARDAGPYPAVPATVLKGADTLVITRTWSFGEAEN